MDHKDVIGLGFRVKGRITVWGLRFRENWMLFCGMFWGGANYLAEIRFYANHGDPQLSLLVQQLSCLQGIRRIEHLPKSDVGWKVEQSPMFFRTTLSLLIYVQRFIEFECRV